VGAAGCRSRRRSVAGRQRTQTLWPQGDELVQRTLLDAVDPGLCQQAAMDWEAGVSGTGSKYLVGGGVGAGNTDLPGGQPSRSGPAAMSGCR